MNRLEAVKIQKPICIFFSFVKVSISPSSFKYVLFGSPKHYLRIHENICIEKLISSELCPHLNTCLPESIAF